MTAEPGEWPPLAWLFNAERLAGEIPDFFGFFLLNLKWLEVVSRVQTVERTME
ncbi:hypothetical protein [Microvirga sp. VF16]|uniref:hypothetical protein n=1 Tax=Microvirga sp. VF16 TaxID=2807101 RepID=UPI00193E6771|nr:hypothetical protein [Microvirga sp. VF16]QRM35247.1 hypothetical protein JO965_40470 [Microvirga sp. VF16]